jgi:dTDP-3-amino-3,4,6-trideoxy-alpha-D-glucose transaminase
MTERILTVPVPFLDLATVHRALAGGILDEVALLFETGAFTNGPQVSEFEREFAASCGRRHCVGVASGLDALRLALIAAGLEPGDEVIVPPNTFIATFEAVTQAGGVPVPAEVSELDYNIDPAAVETAITPRTRFLLPVHLYGQLADMKALAGIAERRGLRIVEDACQAHRAERDGAVSGDLSLAAAFSFYPSKNLGALGDAGALVTDDPSFAGRVAGLREHGQRSKYHHDEPGYTARLDTIQAIVLRHKLPSLGEWTDARRAVARYYADALEGVGDLRLPAVARASNPVWYVYAIRTRDPDDLARFLGERGIGTGRHYPEPVHLSAAYSHLGHGPGSFPVAERLCAECLSLPVYPGMTEEALESVAAAVRAYF